MPPSLAVAGFARDVSLVFALLIVAMPATLVLGTMARAHDQMGFGSAVSTNGVFWASNVQSFQGRWLSYGDLEVGAVVPAAGRCSWAVVLDEHGPYGA